MRLQKRIFTLFLLMSLIASDCMAETTLLSFSIYRERGEDPITYMLYQNVGKVDDDGEEEEEEKPRRARDRQDLSSLPATWLSGDFLFFECQQDHQAVDACIVGSSATAVLSTTLLMTRDQLRVLDLSSLPAGQYSLYIKVDGAEDKYKASFYLSH